MRNYSLVLPSFHILQPFLCWASVAEPNIRAFSKLLTDKLEWSGSAACARDRVSSLRDSGLHSTRTENRRPSEFVRQML